MTVSILSNHATQVNLKLFAPEPNRAKSMLLFVIRDKTRTPLPKLVEVGAYTNTQCGWHSYNAGVTSTKCSHQTLMLGLLSAACNVFEFQNVSVMQHQLSKPAGVMQDWTGDVVVCMITNRHYVF